MILFLQLCLGWKSSPSPRFEFDPNPWPITCRGTVVGAGEFRSSPNVFFRNIIFCIFLSCNQKRKFHFLPLPYFSIPYWHYSPSSLSFFDATPTGTKTRRPLHRWLIQHVGCLISSFTVLSRPGKVVLHQIVIGDAAILSDAWCSQGCSSNTFVIH